MDCKVGIPLLQSLAEQSGSCNPVSEGRGAKCPHCPCICSTRNSVDRLLLAQDQQGRIARPMERGEDGSKQKLFPVTLRTLPFHGSNWSSQCFSPDPKHDPDPDPKPDLIKSVSRSVMSDSLQPHGL